MRDSAEDMEHQFSCGGRCVDLLLKANQVDLSGFEVIDCFQQLLERPAQAVESDNSQCVVGACLIEQSI